MAKTGIVYRATASIGGWGTVLLSTFSKAPVDGLAELDRSAAVREFRAFARFPWRTVTSFRRLRGRDARWSRWVNASVACGLAVATPQTGSASDPLFSTVSVTHVSGGVQAPDFALATADGKKVALAGLKGNVVLLNFWATWCPPCREEMPSMERLHQELREQGRPPPLAAPSAWRGGSAASGSFEGRPSRGGPIGPRWSALLTVVGEV